MSAAETERSSQQASSRKSRWCPQHCSSTQCKGTLVYGALCFVESDWGLLDFPFQVGSVWVLYPGALRKRLKKNGPLSREAMERAARAIALGLPAATSH